MIGNDWDNILGYCYCEDYFKDIFLKLDDIRKKNIVYPLEDDIFRALKLTPYHKVSVVILGQDPYHGEGEANGLSFSVNQGIPIPPSLKNIFKELEFDLGIKRDNPDLTDWACQGVLLLNCILTVTKDSPASHRNIGWEKFTDEIIKSLDKLKSPIVFILWGNFAKSKIPLIKNKKHLIISSTHPSPFSCRCGFFGSKPFSQANNFLEENGKEKIRW